MLFDLGLIFIFGLIFSKIFSFLNLPDIVGMIFAGIFLNFFNLLGDGIVGISADLRQVALVIILTRAGLSLNINELKKSSTSVILLSFLPACFEIVAVSLLGMLIFNMDLLSALILGSVLSAVSPAIIVPRMINLKKLGFGKKRGVPDIVMAGASIDDIFVIILFYSFVNFDSKNLILLPLNIILGILIGVLCGFILNAFIKKLNLNHFAILYLSTSFILLKLEDFITFSPLLAIMVIGIFINQKNPQISLNLEEKFLGLWSAFSIILFIFVGFSVNLDYVFSYGFKPLILIFIALIFRSVGTYLCVFKSKLNKKEKLFCVMSYLPKATVQAGIGFIPLSLGLPFGELILAISAISIIVTAPLGAILIDCNYKKLLSQN